MIRQWFRVPEQAWDWMDKDKRTLMGEIDKVYKAEKAQHEFWRALADDLYEALDTLLRTGDPRKADAAAARYREAREGDS